MMLRSALRGPYDSVRAQRSALDEARTELRAICRMKKTVMLQLPLIPFLRDLLVTLLALSMYILCVIVTASDEFIALRV